VNSLKDIDLNLLKRQIDAVRDQVVDDAEMARTMDEESLVHGTTERGHLLDGLDDLLTEIVAALEKEGAVVLTVPGPGGKAYG